MKKVRAALLVPLLMVPVLAAAEGVYRWVDKAGQVHYSDLPPPPDAQKVEERMMRGSRIDMDKLPFATRKAAEAFPVTLYTAEKCPGCDLGRKYLGERGIPFAETRITTKEQAEEAAKLLGDKDVTVPVLLVGGKPYKGWLESEWAAGLDAAGYPAKGAKK